MRHFGIVAACLACFAPPAFAQPVDVVVAANYPPLMIEGEPDRPGFAIDVLSEAAKRAGRQTEVQFMPFARAMYAIKKGDAALMPALFFGKPRSDQFDWVVQIDMAQLRFATFNQDAVSDLSAASLLETIVVERGTTSEFLLEQLDYPNVERTNSPQASAQMLAAGRADAWLLTERLMQHAWRTLDMQGRLTFGPVVDSVPIYVVASPSVSPEVQKAYHDAVETMKRDGSLALIRARYAPVR